MEYYSVVKKKEIKLAFNKFTDKFLQYAKQKKTDTRTYILRKFIYIKF